MRRISVYQDKVPYQRDGKRYHQTQWRAEIPDPREAGRIRKVLVFKGTDIPRRRQSKASARLRAEEIFSEWESAAKELTKAGTAQGELTWRELVDLAQEDPGKSEINDGIADSTKTRRSDILNRFTGWLERHTGMNADSIPVSTLTRRPFDAYRNQRRDDGKKSTTTQREFQCLKRAINYAMECKRLADGFENPVPTIKRNKSVDSRRSAVQSKAYSPTEIRLLVRTARDGYTRHVPAKREGTGRKYNLAMRVTPPDYLGDAMELAYELGLRPGELVGLKWSAVDLEGGMLEVEDESSKTSARNLPITSSAGEILRSRKESRGGVHVLTSKGKPVTYNAARLALRRLTTYLKMPSRGWYGFRHAFGIRMANAGLGIHRIKTLMGHTSIETTQIYLECEASEFQDEFRAIAARTELGR